MAGGSVYSRYARCAGDRRAQKEVIYQRVDALVPECIAEAHVVGILVSGGTDTVGQSCLADPVWVAICRLLVHRIR